MCKCKYPYVDGGDCETANWCVKKQKPNGRFVEHNCYMGTCVSYDTGYGLEEIADESGGSSRL